MNTEKSKKAAAGCLKDIATFFIYLVCLGSFFFILVAILGIMQKAPVTYKTESTELEEVSLSLQEGGRGYNYYILNDMEIGQKRMVISYDGNIKNPFW